MSAYAWQGGSRNELYSLYQRSDPRSASTRWAPRAAIPRSCALRTAYCCSPDRRSTSCVRGTCAGSSTDTPVRTTGDLPCSACSQRGMDGVPDSKLGRCDPGDEFLETAWAGDADCLVAGDQDRLVLSPFARIPVQKPADFLAQGPRQPCCRSRLSLRPGRVGLFAASGPRTGSPICEHRAPPSRSTLRKAGHCAPSRRVTHRCRIPGNRRSAYRFQFSASRLLVGSLPCT